MYDAITAISATGRLKSKPGRWSTGPALRREVSFDMARRRDEQTQREAGGSHKRIAPLPGVDTGDKKLLNSLDHHRLGVVKDSSCGVARAPAQELQAEAGTEAVGTIEVWW